MKFCEGNLTALLPRTRLGISTLTVIFVLCLAACANDEKREDPVALVGDVSLSLQEFEYYLKHKKLINRSLEEREKILRDYAQSEALMQAMASSNSLDMSEIDAEVEVYKQQVIRHRYFEQFLSERVDDTAVQNYYTANPQNFEERKVKVAHLLLRTPRSMSESEELAVLTLANDLRGKVRSGQAFDELVKEYSEDTMSAKNGGDLGWIKSGAIDPAFSSRAFELALGEISEPVKTAFGYHLITVLEPAKTIKKPLDMVKGDIRYELRTQAKQAEMQRLAELMSIEIYPEVLASR